VRAEGRGWRSGRGGSRCLKVCVFGAEPIIREMKSHGLKAALRTLLPELRHAFAATGRPGYQRRR